MKKTVLFLVLVGFLCLVLCPLPALSQEASRLGPKYGGRTFKSPSDPDYLSYEREIKSILLDKIRKQYGVDLNGDALSSEQLLEIDALLRLKRSDESVDQMLTRFPGALRQATSG
jgi:hypothetical protein